MNKAFFQNLKLNIQYFGRDIDRYRLKPRSRLGLIILTQGLWALAVYRFFYTFVRIKTAFLRKAFHWMSILCGKWIQIVAGISIPAECEIGPGLYIDHFGGVVLNPRVRVGSNCNIGHGVTIGSGGRGYVNGESLEGVPVLGDRVFVGPGACVFGPISIGNDVAIGANAVVTKSLPDRSVAIGIPARVISYKGSFLYVNYLGMETDPRRQASIQLQESHQYKQEIP
jgi:serine O-acetyltransferase